MTATTLTKMIEPVEPQERCELPLLGMHCAACATRIEKALNRVEGVTAANVNFATTRATVHYDPQKTNASALREAIQKAGYDAILPQVANAHDTPSVAPQDAEVAAREAEYKGQKTKFTTALALSLPVAIMAMAGHLVPAWESVFNFQGRNWIELALTSFVLIWRGS